MRTSLFFAALMIFLSVIALSAAVSGHPSQFFIAVICLFVAGVILFKAGSKLDNLYKNYHD